MRWSRPPPWRAARRTGALATLCLTAGCASDGSLEGKPEDVIPLTFDGVCSSWLPVDAPHQFVAYEVEGRSGWGTLTIESGTTGTFLGESLFASAQTTVEDTGETWSVTHYYKCDQGNVYYIGRASTPDTQCPGDPLPTGVEICDAPILEWSDAGFLAGGWVGRANCTWTVSLYNSDCENREEYQAEEWVQVVERQWTVIGPETVETEFGMIETTSLSLFMPFYGSSGVTEGYADFWLAESLGVVRMETAGFYDRAWATLYHQLLTDVIPVEE